MILRYLAAVQIVVLLIRLIMTGKAYAALRKDSVPTDDGVGVRLDSAAVAALVIFCLLVLAYLGLMVWPGTPSLVLMAMAASFCALAVALFLKGRGSWFGYYFTLSTAALIAIGNEL